MDRPRSSSFHSSRQPLKDLPYFRPSASGTTGPFNALNPTQHRIIHTGPGAFADGNGNSDGRDEKDDADTDDTRVEQRDGKDTADAKLPRPLGRSDTAPADFVAYKWTSRNNRKGRHLLEFTPAADPANARYEVPEPTSSPRQVARGIARMFTAYPVWDISWLVAYTFTWGSIIWVINAFFAWLPLQDAGTLTASQMYWGGGITAFIGATVFEVGSWLLMLEAINEHRTGCFGWACQQLVEGRQRKVRFEPALDRECAHHHRNRANLVGKPAKTSSARVDDDADKLDDEGGRSWAWYVSGPELRAHYSRELGFLACAAQLCGATIFWIAGFTALPGIMNHLQPRPHLLDGVFWVPQVIGGTGFVISGTLFMLETQERWWKPAFGVLGWHIGLWNLIGGIGFTLCPIFGFYTSEAMVYQSALATFWGSWAFLIGSVIQLYESLQKNPVEITPYSKFLDDVA